MGTRIDAYRNLNDECISIRSREPENRGLVIDHVDTVRVTDVEFAVEPSGPQRVRDNERKDVHAYVRGRRADTPIVPTTTGTEITYNPYKYDSFVAVQTERPVEKADSAIVTSDGIIGFGIVYQSEIGVA